MSTELKPQHMIELAEAIAGQEADETSSADVSEYVAGLIALKFDVNERTMYLMGEIDAEVAAQFIIVLDFLNNVSHDPIRIILSCPGGEEEAGYAIYDAVRLSKSPVLIDGIGMVASMAAVVLQAGDIRRLSQNAVFMIHNGSMSLPDHLEQDKVVSLSNLIKTNAQKYHNLLSQRSRLPLEEIRKMSEAETFMSAGDAVRKGFADYLWLPRKKRTEKLLRKWVSGHQKKEEGK